MVIIVLCLFSVALVFLVHSVCFISLNIQYGFDESNPYIHYGLMNQASTFIMV